jgi:hypothetical protein
MSSPALEKAISKLLWPNPGISDAGRPQVRPPHLRWTVMAFNAQWPHEIPPPGTLPYGWWREADGCEVAFSHAYVPMFRVHPDGRVTRCDPNEFIEFVITCWFYDDHCNPHERKHKFRRKVLEALAADLEIRCERDKERGPA